MITIMKTLYQYANFIFHLWIVVSTYIVGCIKYNFLVREKDNEGCVLEHQRYIRASNPKS